MYEKLAGRRDAVRNCIVSTLFEIADMIKEHPCPVESCGLCDYHETEVLELCAALSEAREAFEQIDTPLMINGEAASDADTLDMHEMVARAWLAKWGTPCK